MSESRRKSTSPFAVRRIGPRGGLELDEESLLRTLGQAPSGLKEWDISDGLPRITGMCFMCATCRGRSRTAQADVQSGGLRLLGDVIG